MDEDREKGWQAVEASRRSCYESTLMVERSFKAIRQSMRLLRSPVYPRDYESPPKFDPFWQNDSFPECQSDSMHYGTPLKPFEIGPAYG
jgi:hypothetical protein